MTGLVDTENPHLKYRKMLNFEKLKIITIKVLKNWTVLFHNEIIRPKDTDRMEAAY